MKWSWGLKGALFGGLTVLALAAAAPMVVPDDKLPDFLQGRHHMQIGSDINGTHLEYEVDRERAVADWLASHVEGLEDLLRSELPAPHTVVTPTEKAFLVSWGGARPDRHATVALAREWDLELGLLRPDDLSPAEPRRRRRPRVARGRSDPFEELHREPALTS